MKNHLKFNLLILLALFSFSSLQAQLPEPCPDGFECEGGGGDGGQGTGGRSTPIDDYIPALVVTAIMIGGAISYKQKELFRK
ncbi:hypothetical protein [Chishuiella changwenlii]|jgi:hypothetical protein|uniref:hypothetical protein n=1 Tax=Chishuiella changwenlii TaxID=1434701 RepID=UPI002FDAE589